jgi:hypothetical protein
MAVIPIVPSSHDSDRTRTRLFASIFTILFYCTFCAEQLLPDALILPNFGVLLAASSHTRHLFRINLDESLPIATTHKQTCNPPHHLTIHTAHRTVQLRSLHRVAVLSEHKLRYTGLFYSPRSPCSRSSHGTNLPVIYSKRLTCQTTGRINSRNYKAQDGRRSFGSLCGYWCVWMRRERQCFEKEFSRLTWRVGRSRHTACFVVSRVVPRAAASGDRENKEKCRQQGK